MKPTDQRRGRRRQYAVFWGLLLIVLIGLLVAERRRTRVAQERGHQLLEAIAGVPRLTLPLSPDSPTPAEIVASHREQLHTIHHLLSQPCRIPPGVSAPQGGGMYTQVLGLGNAGTLLTLAALDAEGQQETSRAISLWLDQVRLAQFVAQASSPRHRQGIANELSGWTGLQRLARRLTAVQCRDALTQAVALQTVRPSDHNLGIRQACHGWWWRWVKPGQRGISGRQLVAEWAALRMDYRHGHAVGIQFIRLVSEPRERALVQLALRAFHLEHGRAPTNLAEIVPAYLPKAPEKESLRAKLGSQ